MTGKSLCRIVAAVSALLFLSLSARAQGPYSLSNTQFFKQAVSQMGAVPAVFATADRITRNTRIGTAQSYHPFSPDGKIHQGVEPYLGLSRRQPFMPQELPFAASGSLSASAELQFVDYMISSGFAPQAHSYLCNAGFAPSDTLDFLKGWACFNEKELALAAAYFKRTIPSLTEKSEPAGIFMQCAYALLEGDNAAYSAIRQSMPQSDSYLYADGLAALDAIYAQRSNPRRSPALAAGLSAIVPGLGKVYAGRVDEGIISFLTVGTLAAVTADLWVHAGAADWRTILVGTLGSIFYIGNIYGSYVSVGLQTFEQTDAQNTAIVYNLHIPLRNFYR